MSETPYIQSTNRITLTPDIETLLKKMFSHFERVVLEEEFGRGFSGSRAFRVRLFEPSGAAQLPAVVKIAAPHLIWKEWRAYDRWVRNKLSQIARLEDEPVELDSKTLAGIRYSLVGDGTFRIRSLRDHYRQASIDDLHWILEGRLFRIMGLQWWLDNQTERSFQMQSDYDILLPVNLSLHPLNEAPQGQIHTLAASPTMQAPALQKGDYVYLTGFVIDKVDHKKKELTLNLPPLDSPMQVAPSYRIRLLNVPHIEQYQVDDPFEAIYAEVLVTRYDALVDLVRDAFNAQLEPAAGEVTLPTDRAAAPILPNPLLRYEAHLHEFLTVKVSTVHGDLNVENVLIDPATQDVSLIDFATARRGHNLHDLLRLETEVLITLLPPLIAADPDLTFNDVYQLYQQLHWISTRPDQATVKIPATALEKPFQMLYAIRRMARKCLFDSDNWHEYYRGLSLYLLGAMKFDALSDHEQAPLPRQLAFIGAALAQHFLDEPEQPPADISESRPVTPIRSERPEPADEIEPPFGAMHPDSKFYIERQTDEECQRLLEGEQAVTLYIQAARQMGKTSLMRRALERMQRLRPKQFVFVDFQKIPEEYFESEEDFLIEFCLMIGDTLNIPEEIDKYWRGRRTNNSKCSRYLSKYIIPHLNSPLILAMDEVERMMTSVFRANFFGMLRAWHNERHYDDSLSKLSLFLSSSTDPYLLIDDRDQSPFNVADQFDLQSFSIDEVRELNRRHASPLSQAEVEALVGLVDGHPFLTRLALYYLATGRIADWPTLLEQATDDDGPFGDHLRHYLLRILDNPDLKDAVIQICREQRYEENYFFYRLKAAGLIKKVGQQIVLRNELYHQYFRERLNA